MKIKDVVKINELNINSKYPYSEIEYIDTASLTEGRFEKLQHIQLKDAPSRAKRIVRHNDILISTVRPNLKHFGIAKNPSSKTVASTGFAVITCKKVCPDYLYRLMTTNWYTDFLSGIAESQQSNYPAFNPSLIENTTIDLPDLPIQRKIAAVLSAYDDLIENNNRRIAILEKMAEELYREWFVRLRFPGHEKVKIVKGVPEGWEVNKVEDCFKTSSGGTPSRQKESEYYNGNIEWIKTGELKDTFIINTDEKITELGLKNSSAKLFPPFTLIMAMYGVNIGQLGITLKSSATNQACCAFLPIDTSNYSLCYLFFYLKSIREYLFNISMGAAQQNLSQDIIKRLTYLKPSPDLLNAFEEIQWSTFECIVNLKKQTNNLFNTRDRLLARLMSGKIDVENLDIQFPDSMKEVAAANA